jgi:hypothetical protein
MDGFGLSTSRLSAAVLLAAGLLLCGAGCRWLMPQPEEVFAGPALPPSPTLEQIASVVNQNSGQIRSFTANQATLSGQGFPSLRATVQFERPGRLRLVASTALMGPEIDLGSNEELFWIWIRRNQPPALYYCRHDQYASSPARRTLGVDPDWLIEAAGVTQIDPNLPHLGPRPLPGGRYEIRLQAPSPDGPTTKILVVDGRGLVLEQHEFDAQGQLIASAVNRSHRRDPRSGLVMPRVVEIQAPRMGLSMRLDLGNVEINGPSTETAAWWTMPHYEGWPPVDLCDPSLQFVPPARQAYAPPSRPRDWRNASAANREQIPVQVSVQER